MLSSHAPQGIYIRNLSTFILNYLKMFYIDYVSVKVPISLKASNDDVHLTLNLNVFRDIRISENNIQFGTHSSFLRPRTITSHLPEYNKMLPQELDYISIWLA